MSLLPANWQLPEEIRNRIGNRAGRQRAMSYDGHLLLVLHAPPESEETERQGRLIWRSPDGAWHSSDLGTGVQALGKHVDQYDELIARLDVAEGKAQTSNEYFEILDRLAPVCRSARHLHQVLQEARKLCPDDRDIINLRDRAYSIERNAELLYEETKNSLDYRVVKRAEEQAELGRHMEVTAHRLNMLVAFFFPIATLTAIFGINLTHGFETRHSPFLFLAVIGIGLLLGLILTVIVNRRRYSESKS